MPILFAANVAVLVVGFLFGFTRGRLYTILVGSLLLLQLSSLLLLDHDRMLYGASTLVRGQALMLLGNAILVALVIASERIDVEGVSSNRQPMTLRRDEATRYLVLVVTLLVAAYAARFRSGLGAGFSTWQQARASSSAIDSIANVLGFFAAPSPLVLWWSRRRVAAVLITPFILVYLQLAGSRAMALTIPAFVILALMRTREPLSLKLTKVFVLGAVAMTMFAAFRVVRNVPLAELRDNLGAALSTPGNDISGGESRIVGSFYYLLSAEREDFPYGSGVTAQRLATIYIPRGGGLIPKPLDVTYEIWSDYVDDGYLDRDPFYDEIRAIADAETPGSDHPTVWGDAYANFGALGIPLYAIVLGGAAVVLDLLATRLSAVARVLVLPVAAVTYQFIARGNVVIAVGYMAYGLPIVFALLWAVRLRVLSREHDGEPARGAPVIASVAG